MKVKMERPGLKGSITTLLQITSHNNQ